MTDTSSKTFKKTSPKTITRIGRPFKQFIKNEAISGILLIISVIIALILSNTSTHDQYEAFWEVNVGILFGSFNLTKALHLWINDFLMALFFLLVGLEIKREILIGELSTVKRALLPTVAAIGGMVVPALFYIIFNPPGTPEARGWAIPMATDIAFSLGILFLLGTRVPSTIRVFLASLAIVDDIGAVLVIAFFFSEQLQVSYLIYSGVVVVLLILLNKIGISKLMPYLILGFLLWYFVLLSGVHATIAGVILAFTIPATTKIDYEEFRILSTNLVNQMNTASMERDLEGRNLKIYQNTVLTLEQACEDVEAPLQILEHRLVPIVTFAIMPLFAISNAGVIFNRPIGDILTNSVVIGVIVGLTLGKPIGIFAFTYLADRLGIVEKPTQLSWLQILGVGFLAGIGFTMAMFINVLAFPESIFPAGNLIALTKIGILISSTLSALIGVGILMYASNQSRPFTSSGEAKPQTA